MRQRVAVKAGCHIGGSAGDPQKNGGDQATGGSSEVQAQDQGHGRDRIQQEGDWQRQRHSNGGIESGDAAEDIANGNACQNQQQDIRF